MCRWARSWARSGRSGTIQDTFGEDACHRYVVSFTHGAEDVLDVLRLAALAGGPRALDVVPLFESADALADCEAIVDRLLSDPGYREHLDRRGGGQEVMLGLLRLDQGVGTAGGRLDAVPRPGAAGRRQPSARRPADAVPWSGWRHRPRRRAR